MPFATKVPSSQPLLQKHYGRRTRSPESGGHMCFSRSILPRISLLSSSTAEAVGQVRGKVARLERLCNLPRDQYLSDRVPGGRPAQDGEAGCSPCWRIRTASMRFSRTDSTRIV